MSCNSRGGERTFNSESVRREKLHMLARNRMTLAMAMIRMNLPWRFSRKGRYVDKRPSIPPPRRFSKKGLRELIPKGDIGEGGVSDMQVSIARTCLFWVNRGGGNKRELVK